MSLQPSSDQEQQHHSVLIIAKRELALLCPGIMVIETQMRIRKAVICYLEAGKEGFTLTMILLLDSPAVAAAASSHLLIMDPLR